jgi:hypothetical protein
MAAMQVDGLLGAQIDGVAVAGSADGGKGLFAPFEGIAPVTVDEVRGSGSKPSRRRWRKRTGKREGGRARERR